MADGGARGWLGRSFYWAAACVIGLVCLAAWLAAIGAQPSRVAGVLVLACAPYLALLSARVPDRLRDVRLAVLAALVPGACLCAAPSVLSDDLFRYAWDARVWLAGHDAYARAPSDPSLAMLRDHQVFARINHRSVATIYPPVAQLLFVAFFVPGQKVFMFKVGALVAHLVTVACLPGLVRRLRPAATREEGIHVAFLYALNPLALVEGALSGHIDPWVGLLLLWVAAQLAGDRAIRAAIVASLATGIKLVGLSLVPLLLRRSLPAGLLCLALSVAMVGPLVSAGADTGDARSGLGQFGQFWRGNEGPFWVIEQLMAPVVELAASESGAPSGRIGPDEVAFAPLRPWLLRLVALGVDPHAPRRVQRKAARDPAIFDRAYAVGMLARALAGTLVLALALRAARAPGAGVAIRAVLLSLLLMSPQVHPWYLLWLLPLEIALGRRVVVVWGTVILGAYGALDGWQTARVWLEPAGYRSLEYLIVGGALLLEQKRGIRDALTRCGWRLKLINS
ncbi:MAG: hypothetical protein OXU20_23260 [Myxococcales bacterium]|nr:hypothetical protein [Myxococcales bacterium]MDD9968869.1 hypothetical protein [Myxococcales bacterium]